MKKTIFTLLLCILCLPTILLGACGNKENNGIDISVYFEKDATYQVYAKNGKNTLAMNSFVSEESKELLQYSSVTFTGKPAWLYKMNIEKITFDVVANAEVEDLQLTLTFTNLENGNPALTSSNTLTKEVAVHTVKNGKVPVTVEINDIIKSNTASTTIKIAVDSAYYKGDNAELNFKLDFLNLKVFGQHK